ncbi:hypothetical protein SAMN04489857_0676 [Parafannyhessea umbonata]|uniref:Uncharacterized protein n=1 Tax=Parafannyhessea umbonata TaxID=604330 RepID=A0A1H1L3V7_9ACTN|nr:hypothetical protein SAMN04489857_0676 [Parafannyhessea umbonata]
MLELISTAIICLTAVVIVATVCNALVSIHGNGGDR